MNDRLKPNEKPRSELAFVTGCGRSGTTILGSLLAQHPEIRVLNDRFDLWVHAFPASDIWGKADQSKVLPRVHLDAHDAQDQQARAELVTRLEAERMNRPLLVEKLAINNFRLEFLAALFPDAIFINILRHGVEVATSIAKSAAQGRWYGTDDQKWTLLCNYASRSGYAELLDNCTGPFEKALLEWRMSVEAAGRFKEQYPARRVLQLRYEDLLNQPLETCTRLEHHLGLSPNENMRRFATEQIERKSLPASSHELPFGAPEIAGQLLTRLGYWNTESETRSNAIID